MIVATGGLSVPATGSDGTGLDIARRLGHRMIDTYPALTPLLGKDEAHASLSGVSLNVRLRAQGRSRKITETFGGFLFTHRGYSGPSVLDISHLTARGDGPDHSRAVVRAHGAAEWAQATCEAPGVGRPSWRSSRATSRRASPST